MVIPKQRLSKIFGKMLIAIRRAKRMMSRCFIGQTGSPDYRVDLLNGIWPILTAGTGYLLWETSGNALVAIQSQSLHFTVFFFDRTGSWAWRNKPILFRTLFVREVFFRDYKQTSFCFQAMFRTVNRENRACFSRNESDYSRRGTHIKFGLLKGRRYERFGL